MGVNLPCCCRATEWPVNRAAGQQSGQATELLSNRTAGEGLLFMSGAFGEPPFLYAVALFKDFQNAPEG